MKSGDSKLILLLFLGLMLWVTGCDQPKTDLPYLGFHDYPGAVVDGKTIKDTVYHTIPEFTFMDQDSNLITRQTFSDKLYIADFFFTSCPTICPTVKGQMLRVYNRYADEDNLKFISHSIDTRHDSVPVLKSYAEKLKISTDRWHLVTGVKKEIYGIAQKYIISAAEDEDAPGGYTHSGGLVLVDTDYRVRGIYDGTDPEQVDELMEDIALLLKLEGFYE